MNLQHRGVCILSVRQRRGLSKPMSGYFWTRLSLSGCTVWKKNGPFHCFYSSLADARVLLSHRWAERSTLVALRRLPTPVPEHPLTQTEAWPHAASVPAMTQNQSEGREEAANKCVLNGELSEKCLFFFLNHSLERRAGHVELWWNDTAKTGGPNAERLSCYPSDTHRFMGPAAEVIGWRRGRFLMQRSQNGVAAAPHHQRRVYG